MLNVTLNVNGIMIRHYYIVNLTLQTQESVRDDELCRYRWQSFEVRTGRVIKGSVEHLQMDGAEALLFKVIEAERKMNENKHVPRNRE